MKAKDTEKSFEGKEYRKQIWEKGKHKIKKTAWMGHGEKMTEDRILKKFAWVSRKKWEDQGRDGEKQIWKKKMYEAGQQQEWMETDYKAVSLTDLDKST